VSLGINSTTLSGLSDLFVFNPDGTQLAFDGSLNVSDNLHLTLPATGSYRILLDPDATSTGSVTLTLSSEVNGGVVTVNGSSLSANVSETLTRE
jgi:hypothetical protein